MAKTNFKNNQSPERFLNISLQFRLKKSSEEDKLLLSVDQFEDIFEINEVTNDTLIFKKPKLEINRTNMNSVESLVLHKTKGIVSLKKGDSSVWKAASNF